jgi:hypothetical protein
LLLLLLSFSFTHITSRFDRYWPISTPASRTCRSSTAATASPRKRSCWVIALICCCCCCCCCCCLLFVCLFVCCCWWCLTLFTCSIGERCFVGKHCTPLDFRVVVSFFTVLLFVFGFDVKLRSRWATMHSLFLALMSSMQILLSVNLSLSLSLSLSAHTTTTIGTIRVLDLQRRVWHSLRGRFERHFAVSHHRRRRRRLFHLLQYVCAGIWLLLLLLFVKTDMCV